MTIPKGLSIPTNSQVPYANFSNPCMDWSSFHELSTNV
jgi:hypothetical protein